jgi:hypothetical protein
MLRRSLLARATYPRILANVAQITLYVPDAVAQKLRADARRAKKSLSAYVTELARGRPSTSFPDWFLELEGSTRGTLVHPDDPPPDEPEEL